MYTLESRNVNDAWMVGREILLSAGRKEQSRAGEVIVYPEPVTTVYHHPEERVLLDPIRDANPFFHLFESMWMLSGRSDATWLDQFVRDFSSRFAEPSGHMHGAYGQRWRRNFLINPGALRSTRDQLYVIADMLRRDPTTRRAVLAMWDPSRDLAMNFADHPCNTHIYFRVRQDPMSSHVLDMGVCCRSNDIVWGAYGANAVHMSVLHEFMAALSGMRQGRMWQISWNWHAYTKVLGSKMGWQGPNPYISDVAASPLFLVSSAWDVTSQLDEWYRLPSSFSPKDNRQLFGELLCPMWTAHDLWKRSRGEQALEMCDAIVPTDWRTAARQWIQRRVEIRSRRDDRVLELPQGPGDAEPEREGGAGQAAE